MAVCQVLSFYEFGYNYPFTFVQLIFFIVILSIQHHKRSDIHSFITYATGFDLKLRPPSGKTATILVKGRRTKRRFHYIHIKFRLTKKPLLYINPLNPELNPICYLLALLGAHHFLHVSRIRVKLLTFRLLMSYIYIWSTYS